MAVIVKRRIMYSHSKQRYYGEVFQWPSNILVYRTIPYLTLASAKLDLRNWTEARAKPARGLIQPK